MIDIWQISFHGLCCMFYCALFIYQKAIRLTAYNKRIKPDVISYENVVAIITVPLKSESRDE